MQAREAEVGSLGCILIKARSESELITSEAGWLGEAGWQALWLGFIKEVFSDLWEST